MKLIDVEEHEPHLPEDPGKKRSELKRRAEKLWQALSSRKGVTIEIALIFFLALNIILNIGHFGASKYIDKQGASLKDIYADSDVQVEDTEETQRKIERAKQNVALVYKNREGINQSIHDGLNHILDDLAELTEVGTNTASNKQNLISDLISESPEAQGILNRLGNRTMTPEHWDKLNLIAHESLKKLLKQGMTPSDYLDKRETLIRQQIPHGVLTRLDADIIAFAINASIQPNIVVDTERMDKRQMEAAASVEPAIRIYRRGERVVSNGEKMSNVQLSALQRMGIPVLGNNWVSALGVFLLTAAFTITLWAYLYAFDNQRFFKPSYTALMSTLMLVVATGIEVLVSNTQAKVLDSNVLYAFPLAAMALTLSIFMHPRIGMMSTLFTVFVIGMIVKVDMPLLITLLFGSLMGVYILSRRINFRDRGQLMYAGLYIGFTNVVIIFAINLLETVSLFDTVEWHNIAAELAWGFTSGILSGILTLGILPFLESVFRLITPYTLMELANHDKPLLKQMQFDAPGTFHHSLMVASLSEAAAEAIGADALLTRVGCLYHDVGKMKRPLFFIENQAYFGAENPHEKLTPRLSKMVITAHTKDSIEMARQHRLPEAVQRFMTEHHGTMMVGYFYNKACQDEGAENVNKSQFRYPGPKPQSKETAIVMLADACESAVRALKNPTVSDIEERIDKIIEQRIQDGQFDICPLTFKDISIIKSVFIRVLRGIQHNRIEYQQNIMRDLGRKIQTAKAGESPQAKPDPDKINDMLKEIQRSSKAGSPED